MARLSSGHPWNPGYSIPGNVLDEPYGQGVIVTKQVKRGTISALQPEWLVDGAGGSRAGMSGLGSLGCANNHGSLGGSPIVGNSLKCGPQGSLSGTTLDGKEGVDIGGLTDPIANFGRQAARLIMSEVRYLKPSDRVPAMRHILDAIDPALFDMVAERAKAFQEKSGLVPSVAMERALAASLAGRYLEQLARLGRTGQMPTFGVLGLGLGSASPEGLGGFWDFLGSGASAVGGAAKKIGKGIAGLACKAANSSTLQGAAGAAGGAAAAVGAGLASKSLCGKGGDDAGAPPPPPKSSFPLVPVLLGGGLLAFLVLRK
jgi:hypothetical protein